jgi:hypothetical protein
VGALTGVVPVDGVSKDVWPVGTSPSDAKMPSSTMVDDAPVSINKRAPTGPLTGKPAFVSAARLGALGNISTFSIGPLKSIELLK